MKPQIISAPTMPTLNDDKLTVRKAELDDLNAIQEIYVFHVLNSTVSFEERAPSVQEMQQRYTLITSQALPWLVAIINEQIVGYGSVGSIAPAFTINNAGF